MELLHADTIQQLEVALLGSPAVQYFNLLAAGVFSRVTETDHPSQAYTATLMAPTSASILIIGITDSSLTVASPGGSRSTTPPIPEILSKHHQISPTLISQPEVTSKPSSPPHPDPSEESSALPIVAVPELFIPAEAQPEWINQPGGGKEYQCQLCTFHHTNKDCILIHIRKHLDITISCPMCRGFQNAASLCKHGKKAHAIQIVASADEQ